MARYELDDSLREVEIYFDGFPSAAVRDAMKEAGFYWNKKCWKAKQTKKRVDLAKRIAAGTFVSQPEQVATAPMEDLSGDVELPMTRKYCYADSIENFLGTEKAAWVREMRSAFKEEIDLPLERPQVKAWKDCYDVLQRELVGDLTSFHIIFEYVLPYERGRRPDVLLVSNEAVIILEFKGKPLVLMEDLDQAADYGRDIREYHYESRDKAVIPMLVLTKAENISYMKKGVRICSSDQLMDNINAAISSIGSMTSCDIDQWVDSKYESLPTIVEAARRFWNGAELPNIKQVHAGTNLDEAIACLKSVAEDAENAQIAVPCTGCSYCTEGCPMNIPIPKYFSLYNENMREDMAQKGWTVNYSNYSNLTESFGRAADCIACGQCESVCPQHLPIIELMKKVSDHFDH